MVLEPGQTVADPAYGTGGFSLAAYDCLNVRPLDRDQKVFLHLREPVRARADLVRYRASGAMEDAAKWAGLSI